MAVNPIGAVEGSPEIIVEIKGSGPKGDTGVSISDISRTSGTGEPGTTDTYTITLTNGATHNFAVYNGANGEVPIATVSRYNGTSKTYFTATVDGITEYKPGLMLMCVPGLNQESSDNVKLNVNGLGYKDIYGITLQGDGSMIYQTVKPFIPQMATLLIYRNSFWVAIDHISLKSDEVPTKNSTNLVQSGGVFAALAAKQDVLTGTQGQFVGFDADGNAVAQEAANGGAALESLAECGILTPAYQDGVFYTDADGAIYVL